VGAKRKLSEGEKAPDFTATDALGKQIALSQFIGDKHVVLVFRRYAGCPLCQLSMAELKNKYQEFKQRDAEIIVFVQSPKKTLEQQGVEGFPFAIIPDPEEKYYELYGVGSGNIFDVINPDVIRKGIRATLKGHVQGKMEGNAWQLPGDFIVSKEGLLMLARVGENVGDGLSAEKLLSHI